MTRRILTTLLRLALRVFFRRIEAAGAERVPRDGAVIFVMNHPNALVDPVFLLCLAPRRVSFLAKSTLFKMPVIKFFVRALDAIPVYRKQDAGEDTSKNRETFERAHALLKRGGTLGICPEGVSHNEASLRPLKSGAARIALGAAATASGTALDVRVVPVGLYYTAKTTFRSSALLYFGEPLRVAPCALDAGGEPPREAVRELNARIEGALREVTLNAEHHEALATIARAERIFSAEDEDDDREGQTLTRELKLRRRFVEGYAFHRTQSPERVAALEARISKYEAELKEAGFEDPRDLSTVTLSKNAATLHVLARFITFLLLAPVALAGALLHYPAYRLAGFLSTTFSKNYDDMVSTIKIIAAMLFFPLTWIALAVVAYVAFKGWGAGLLAFVLTPLAGYVALRFSEEFDRFVGGIRALAFFITERRFFKQLLAERKAIRREILALADEATRAGALKTSV